MPEQRKRRDQTMNAKKLNAKELKAKLKRMLQLVEEWAHGRGPKKLNKGELMQPYIPRDKETRKRKSPKMARSASRKKPVG
jgi:hypothetical protein